MMRFGKFFQIALLILIAAGAQPAYSAFWQWSKTAANNATADPSINWSEGQSPSSVNDSARAMMARAAEYRDDISGALSTGGTSTAYTLTTNQGGFSSPPSNGQMLAFRANVTNGIGATLVVDGATAYPLQVIAGTSIGAGTIVAGTVYRISFNSSAVSWMLEGGTGNPYNVPLGSIMWSTLTTAPNANFVAPSGQCLSTTTYAAYWVALGSPASGACAGGQFQIVDMRGYVTAGLDTLNASAANRLTNAAGGCGTAMTTVGAVCANGVQGDSITLAQLPAITSVTASAISVVSPAGQIPYTSPGGSVVTTQSIGAPTGSTPAPVTSVGSGWLGTTTLSTAAAVSVTSTNTTGSARPRVAPTIGLIPYLRVL